MSEAIELMSSRPDQRLSILTDFYRVLLDRLDLLYLIFSIFLYVNLEVLLNNKSGIVDVMENRGLEHILGDIIVSDSDPLLLV